MRGIYTLRQNGLVVCRSENLITTSGKTIILKYLAGHVGSIIQSIALGTGTTAANVADSYLGFEFARTQVSLITPDLIGQRLIFKTELPAGTVGTIYEIGGWSSPENSAESRMVFSFDQSTETWSAGSYIADNTRIGGDSLRLSPTTSSSVTATATDFDFDWSGPTSNDKFRFAFYVGNGNCASVKIRFKKDASNYFEYNVATPTTGYKIQTFSKTGVTQTGTLTWDDVVSVDVIATATSGGATTVDFDGLRVDDGDFIDPDAVLVSRTVLGTPRTLDGLSPLEIEYTLDVTI